MFNVDGAVRLYYDNAEKIATTSTGIDVTGTVTADGLTVGGDILRDVDTSSIVISGGTAASTGANAIFYGSTSGNVNDILLRRNNVKFAAFDGATGDISFYEDTGTTAKFFWDASAESLGIGTTSPSTKLHVGAVSSLVGNLSPQAAIVSDTNSSGSEETTLGIYQGATVVGSAVGLVAGVLSGASPYFAIKTRPSAGGDSVERLRIDSSGNVGIGTTDIGAKLSVRKDASTGVINVLDVGNAQNAGTTGDGARIRLHCTSDENRGVAIGSYSETFYATDNSMVFYTSASSTLSEKMRITSSGNLLVGQTSNSSSDNGIIINPVGLVYSIRDGGVCLALNRKTSDGEIIQLRKDGTIVGSIGTESSEILIGTGNVGVRFVDSGQDRIIPRKTTLANADAAIDLGDSGSRFKNLYLSGGVYVGGTTSANLLDDYETGTFTPTVYSSDNTTVLTSGVDYALNDYRYVKTGNHVMMEVRIRDLRTTKTDIWCTLPFTSLTSDSGVGITAEGDVIYLASDRLNFRKGTNQYPYGIVNFESS